VSSPVQSGALITVCTVTSVLTPSISAASPKGIIGNCSERMPT